jgi:SAM-dependent methyltransferase
MSSNLWNTIWKEQPVEWDPLSEEIFLTMKKETGGFHGKRILEAGAGSGRISLRMAAEGADVTLLDYSDKALELCRNLFERRQMTASYVNADLTGALPFGNDSFDIIWNSGVMEHFSHAEQVAMFERFRPLCRELHTFVPYKGSIFYRLGKWAAEKAGSWRYGMEIPIGSMKPVFENAGFQMEREYPVAHLTSLDFLAFAPGGAEMRNLLDAFLRSLDSEERSYILEQAGGYLLYSKGRREE